MAIASLHVKTDRPKFVVRRLAQFHFGHPIKNFTRIQIAKDASLKLQKKRRVNRVTEIQQRVWAGESIKQRLLRHSDTTHRLELMRTRCGLLIEQTISTSQSMCAQLPLEIINLGFIRRRIIYRSGTEKCPPPSRYFAAKPHPRKIVTRAEWSFCSRAQA